MEIGLFGDRDGLAVEERATAFDGVEQFVADRVLG